MLSRRSFLQATGSAGAAAALAAFDDAAPVRVAAAGERVAGLSPWEVAADESYWREIQQAFTLDRTIINLNNGGVCPSPRVVHEALKRYLDISNQAPVYHMWQILEPNIESVRRRLAASFGCHPEELAITRNASEALQIAQLGIDLKAGDEVLTTNQDYGRMLDTWEQRVRREGIKLSSVCGRVSELMRGHTQDGEWLQVMPAGVGEAASGVDVELLAVVPQGAQQRSLW